MNYNLSWLGKCRSLRIISVFFFGIFAGAVLPLTAKTSSWKDTQGKSFRGEPTDILGPLAIFKTGAMSNRRALLRGLAPEECRRLYEELSHRPARAESWAQAKGVVTSEVIGHVQQLRGKTLVPADLTQMPEPQLLLVLFGSHNDGESWAMVSDIGAIYSRIQRVYPGMLGAVFIGLRHSALEHQEMAISSGMPWLIANFSEQSKMSEFTHFAPLEGTNMVLFTREGVPLFAARASDQAAVRQFADQIVGFLWQVDPANPNTWKDRVAYYSTTRPIEYAQSQAGPMLIGSPLLAEGLRKYGVTQVNAKFEVAADGRLTPTLHSTAAEVAPDLVGPLTDALRQAVVLPAIDHGTAVAGSIEYTLDVPPKATGVEVDAQWIRSTAYPVLPIEQWLVLRPIKVSEQDFTSSVVDETPSGTIVFKALQVSDAKVSRAAQMNAFNTDWFTEAGAASVQPKEGEIQMVDGKSLTWQQIKTNIGFVDLRSGVANIDYAVGYAWAKFDSPTAGNAWLGIGSDDGMKIWLNGELVHDKWVRRQSRIDDDVVALKLKQGKNRFLVKIQNATGDWSFIYRLRIEPK